MSTAAISATANDLSTRTNLHRLSGPERAALEGGSQWDEKELGFGDFLDFINPLQHIPGVSTLYQAATGDEMFPAARIVGSTLLAGPVGMIASIISSVIEQETGGDIGTNALALFAGESPQPQEAPKVAAVMPERNLREEVAQHPSSAVLEAAPYGPVPIGVAAQAAPSVTAAATPAASPPSSPAPVLAGVVPQRRPAAPAPSSAAAASPPSSPPLVNRARNLPSSEAEQDELIRRLGLASHSLREVKQQYQRLQSVEEQGGMQMDISG